MGLRAPNKFFLTHHLLPPSTEYCWLFHFIHTFLCIDVIVCLGGACFICSGEIIATSHDRFPPNGGLVRDIIPLGQICWGFVGVPKTGGPGIMFPDIRRNDKAPVVFLLRQVPTETPKETGFVFFCQKVSE